MASEDEPAVPQPTQARADYAKEMAHTGDAGALAAPRNIDVPLVTGDGTVGATLSCTMGNWTGEPAEYGYQWMANGVAAAGEGATYTIGAADAGKSVNCVVTATNEHGSTQAPPSNAVAVAAA